MHRVVSGTLVALLAGLLTVIETAPAHALPAAPVLSNLSTTQPGHLTGTVTTGPDAAAVSLCFASCASRTGWVNVDPDTHALDFDLPTWGLGSGTLVAVACAEAVPEGTSCTTPASAATTSETLHPTDVTPSVTWPETTIGHNPDGAPQPAEATIEDAGGGRLVVHWDRGTDLTLPTYVPHAGTVDLNVADGVGHFRIQRCSDDDWQHCSEYPALDSATTTVKHGKMTTSAGPVPAITGRDTGATVTITTDRRGDYALDWRLTHANGDTVVGGQETGATADDGTFVITIPAEGLPDGTFHLEGEVTVTEPDFGPYTDTFTRWGARVDRTGPAIESLTVSRATLHPSAIAPLARHRTVRIGVHDDTRLEPGNRIEVRSTDGDLVRSLEPVVVDRYDEHATWDGRDETGTVVAEGIYQITDVDADGNPSAVTATVSVSHDRGVRRTARRTVSATGSKVAQDVARCSKVVTPDSRGWSGSLMLAAGSRCTSGDIDRTLVSTAHAARLPRAVAYDALRIDTEGGASRGSGDSFAVFVGLPAKGEPASRRLGPRLETHAGPTLGPRFVVRSDGAHLATWAVATADRNRYDVRSFTVTVHYFSWR